VSEKEITLIDSRTGARRKIPVPGEFLWLEDLDWSPRHERLLVLTADEGRASHLRTIAADGGSPRLLATDRIEQPRWHPDGSAVLYWRLPADGGKPTLLSIPLDPETGDALGPPRKVLIGPEDKLNWDLSEDGTRLAFTKMTMLRSNLACLTITAGGELSGEPTWLTSGTYTNRAAAISPRGEDVAFARNVGKHWNIFVASLRGGAVRRVTYGETFDFNPVWSPDGSRIAFLSHSSEGNEAASVWIVDALGGTPRRLSDRKASRGLAWAPGERLLSQSLGNRNFSLLDLEGQEHGRLIEDDSVGWAFFPKYSPDGKRVAIGWRRRDRGGLWTIPVGQGEPTLISTDDGYPTGWSNDGHLIFAMTDAVRSLRAHPSSGGQALWSLDLPFDWVLDADARCQGDTISLVVTVPEVTADAYLIEGERSLVD
jgi:Tol biopolymer transport system component